MSSAPQQPAPASWISAARNAGLAGVAFCLVLTTILIVVYRMDRRDSPLASGRLLELKNQLLQRSTDEPLKEEIRRLDESLREKHFQRRAMLERGGYLLLAGVAVLLISWKYVIQQTSRAADPLTGLPPAVDPLDSAPLARRAVSAAAVLFGAALAGAAIMPNPRFGAPSGNSEIATKPEPAPPSDEELARNWTGFRGMAAGIVKGEAPADWDGASGRNILWKSPVPLPGNNSPIVWNDRVLVSGATKELQEIYCFDAATGSMLWRKPVGNPNPARAVEVLDDTGYAASTMTTDGRRAFAIFPNGDVVAVDLAGKVVWSKNLGMPESQYGHASSLVMWRDRLIVQFDQGLEADSGKSALLALDAATGRTLWKTPRPVANSWSSPIVIASKSGPQIITASRPWVIAYEPEKGAELWRANCLEGDVAPSPAFANDRVFVAQEGAKASAIKLGGSGDITATHIAWSIDETLPDIVSPLATGKFVILATGIGAVACFDANDGHKLWDHEFDGPLHASPLLIGNVIYLIDREGITHRFEAAEQFKALGDPALGEPTSATPAVANDRLYIRGKSNLYCIGSK